MLKTRLLSIDAWKDCDNSWFWNNWFCIEDMEGQGIMFAEKNINARYILKKLRAWGFLNEQSKGRLTIDDDGHNIVIIDRKTFEPILALEYGCYWKENNL